MVILFVPVEKNIDDLYTQLIDELTASSREDTKFQYVMKDVFEIMRSLVGVVKILLR